MSLALLLGLSFSTYFVVKKLPFRSFELISADTHPHMDGVFVENPPTPSLQRQIQDPPHDPHGADHERLADQSAGRIDLPERQEDDSSCQTKEKRNDQQDHPRNRIHLFSFTPFGAF